MKHIALWSLHCAVLFGVIVISGCEKEAPMTIETSGWQNRAEAAEKQLAELQLAVRNAQDEEGLHGDSLNETAENMDLLAKQLEEALETESVLTRTIEELDVQRDNALKKLADSEKIVEELSTYLQENEKWIKKLEQENEDLHAALEELEASMTVEQGQVIDEESIIE